MHAKDKFVAYVDILGFSALVEAKERDGGDFTRPLELMKALEHAASTSNVRANGPIICPQSRYLERDLDFQVTQLSDCVVISAEISPAGIANLIQHCFGITVLLLKNGALCRGSVTRGNIHHRDGNLLGSGYERAFRTEKDVAFLCTDGGDKGTPFVQIDNGVVEYVRTETDNCVRKMFDRVTRSDGSYTAIYPFGALGNAPASLVGPDFAPSYWKGQVRKSMGYRQADLAVFEKAEQEADDERAKQKIRHYKRGLEEVMERLRAKEAALDRMISTGQIPYGTVWN